MELSPLEKVYHFFHFLRLQCDGVYSEPKDGVITSWTESGTEGDTGLCFSHKGDQIIFSQDDEIRAMFPASEIASMSWTGSRIVFTFLNGTTLYFFG